MRKSILVVEENPDLADYLLEVLNRKFNTELCPNRREAFFRCQRKEYDLVISDLVFQEGNGLELFYWLKAMNRLNHYILYTGTNDGLSWLKDSHLTAVVRKPYNNRLLQEVQKVLS